MTLTPEVQAVVDKINAAEVSFNELPLTDARALYRDTLARSGGAPLPMAEVSDHPLPLAGRELRLRRYRPEGLAAGRLPTIVYYHGGGWVLGDLDSHDRICRQLAARSHTQVVAVDYRLAPEHRLPASSIDAIDAFGHLVAHPEQHAIDTGAIAVAGDSAGGHLSAVVALAARNAGWPLAFQALVYPGTDLRATARHYPSQRRNGDYPPLTAALMAWFGGFVTDAGTDTSDWRVSPLLAAELAGVAPALVVTCGADVLMDQGLLYAGRLEDAGVHCRHVHYPGVIHGSFEMLAWLDVARAMHDRVADAIASALAVPGHY